MQGQNPGSLPQGGTAVNDTGLVQVSNVSKTFAGGLLRRGSGVKALDDVTISIGRGEILGIIGESGSGKTTLGKLILGLLKPTSGSITFPGCAREGRNAIRPVIQVIFQDPYDSLSHAMTVQDIVAEPYAIHHRGRVDAGKVRQALESVGLTPADEYLGQYPHHLSGGQRQRVAVARAIIAGPDLIIADEPISMLDASISVDILNLILDLNEKLGIAFMFITHDIAAASYVCHNIAVMKDGRIVEQGPRKQIIEGCRHPYTRSLLAAARGELSVANPPLSR
jgi:peptide/nickel transport system ATP-binding protein